MRWAERGVVVLVMIGGLVYFTRSRQESPPADNAPARPMAKAEPMKLTPNPSPKPTTKPATAAKPEAAGNVWGGSVTPTSTVSMSSPLQPTPNPPPSNPTPAPKAESTFPTLPAPPSIPAPVVPASGTTAPGLSLPPAELKLPSLPGTTPAIPSGMPAVAPPTDLLPKPAISLPPLSKLKPLASAPEKAAAVYLNQSRVAVEYAVTKKGPSGLGMVELWIKDANGWSKVNTVKSGEALEADLPADGAYGAKVVPVSGQGIRGAEPAKDAEPDLWVVRDTTAPEVDFKVRAGSYWGDEVSTGTPFIVELTAKDTNLACDTLVVAWSEGDKPATALFTAKELGQEKIETKLGVFMPLRPSSEKGDKKPASVSAVVPPSTPAGVSMTFTWRPAAGVPARVNFTASVKDRAGNVGEAGQANIGTDLTAPAAKVTGVRGVGR